MLSRALGMAREHRRSEQVGAVGWEAVRKVRNTQHATVRNCTQQQPTATAERLATGHDSRGFEKQIKLACSQCRREASSSSWSDISSHGSNSVCEGKRRRRSRLIRLESKCCLRLFDFTWRGIHMTYITMHRCGVSFRSQLCVQIHRARCIFKYSH